MTATGDCYEAALNLILRLRLTGEADDAVLVHGTCMGQGPIEGIRFAHAWVERDGVCFDYSNGRQAEIPREIYYALGRVQDAHYYTREEAFTAALEAEHYGPWAEALLRYP